MYYGCVIIFCLIMYTSCSWTSVWNTENPGSFAPGFDTFVIDPRVAAMDKKDDDYCCRRPTCLPPLHYVMALINLLLSYIMALIQHWLSYRLILWSTAWQSLWTNKHLSTVITSFNTLVSLFGENKSSKSHQCTPWPNCSRSHITKVGFLITIPNIKSAYIKHQVNHWENSPHHIRTQNTTPAVLFSPILHTSKWSHCNLYSIL